MSKNMITAIVFGLLSLHVLACRAAATDTISAGQALSGNATLVSSNSRFALGFYQPFGKSSHKWYLGVWFNTVPKFTPAWVANGDNLAISPTSPELMISDDGNLVIIDQTSKSTIWSTQATNTTTNSTRAMLLSTGNLVLHNSSNSSHILLLMIRRMYGQRMEKLQGGGGIIVFRYADLQRATKNFSDKLGAGGFGSVFKGFLKDSSVVAVKRLDGACQGEKQFRAEVRSVGIIQHINLVKLIGFCIEGDKRLLVYEHMPNHSLNFHLFRSDATILKWSIRYEIALGVARGLAYLHDSCQDSIIHCDIKPENILLDASFVPKIGDFGLAQFLGRDFSRVLTTMRGTRGYLAPEWLSGTAITAKVDVYSYGMVLLEIVSGKRNGMYK